MSDDRFLARKVQAIWEEEYALHRREAELEEELFGESLTLETGYFYELVFNSTVDDGKPPSIKAILGCIREVRADIAGREA